MFFRRVRGTTSPDAGTEADTDGARPTANPGQGVRKTRRQQREQRLKRTKRALLFSIGALSVLLGAAAGSVYLLSERLADQVHRYPDVFEGIPETHRPPASPAKTFLLVGIDSLAEDPTIDAEPSGPSYVPGAQRSDVIMLVRLNDDRTGGSVVSVPRDAWVQVPGYGMSKINSAYSLGGPSLLVRTVEQLTNVRVDHFLVVDFAGFEAMTDAVGGIDVRVAAPTMMGAVSFHAGMNHLDGRKALAYVRQRHGLPRGDLDRIQRQQNALRALLVNAVSSGMLSSPLRTYDFLDTVSRWVGLDDTLTNGGLRSLALELHKLRTTNVVFMTAPVRGIGKEGKLSVVYLDGARSSELWTAFDKGTLDSYLRKYPADVLGDQPR